MTEKPLEHNFRTDWQNFVNKRNLESGDIANCLSGKSSDFYDGLVKSLELVTQSLKDRIQIETPLGAKHVALLAYAYSLQKRANANRENDTLDGSLKEFASLYWKKNYSLEHPDFIGKIVDKEVDKPIGYYAGFAEGIRFSALTIPELIQLNTSEAKTWFILFCYCVRKIYSNPKLN